MTPIDLQNRLRALGFYQGKIDGLIGPLTLNAISSALDRLSVPKEPDATWVGSQQPRRACHTLVWHCTATPEGQEFTLAQIDAMHRARGFSMIGYHQLVHLDGTVSPGGRRL